MYSITEISPNLVDEDLLMLFHELALLAVEWSEELDLDVVEVTEFFMERLFELFLN
jgi:hypothetical protein